MMLQFPLHLNIRFLSVADCFDLNSLLDVVAVRVWGGCGCVFDHFIPTSTSCLQCLKECHHWQESCVRGKMSDTVVCHTPVYPYSLGINS